MTTHPFTGSQTFDSHKDSIMAAPSAHFFSQPTHDQERPPVLHVLPVVVAPSLRRGIHCELFHGRKVHFAVNSAGERLPFVGVPIGQETERDVIGRLWDDLCACDPLLHSLLSASSARPALRLVRD